MLAWPGMHAAGDRVNSGRGTVSFEGGLLRSHKRCLQHRCCNRQLCVERTRPLLCRLPRVCLLRSLHCRLDPPSPRGVRRSRACPSRAIRSRSCGRLLLVALLLGRCTRELCGVRGGGYGRRRRLDSGMVDPRQWRHVTARCCTGEKPLRQLLTLWREPELGRVGVLLHERRVLVQQFLHFSAVSNFTTSAMVVAEYRSSFSRRHCAKE